MEDDAQNNSDLSENWTKATLKLNPLSYCSYLTNYDTKIDYNPDEVEVYYYPYEGNSMPIFGLCVIADKTKHFLPFDHNIIKTGLVKGLLNGYCGYFVVLHNKDTQFDSQIIIHRETSEGASSLISYGLLTLATAFSIFYLN